jgi:acylphosphatase
MKERIHAFISGRVQGVCFRENVRRMAQGLDVKGWASNLADGRVEIIAEGEKSNIETLIEFMKIGPEGARVDKVDLKKEEYKGEFKDFAIKFSHYF